MPEISSIFERQLDFDPAGDFEASLRQAPAKWVVYLLSDANDQPVQRFWRDAHAGRVHAANDPERAYVIFGNHEFGLPPGDTMV